MRLSLGATRGRLARQVLVEALCLSVAGGVLGLAIPVLTTTFVERIVPIGLQAFTVSLGLRLLVWRRALDRDRRVVQPRAGAAIGARVHRRGAAAARAQCRRTEPRVSRRPRRAAGGRHAGAARCRRADAANARQPERGRARIRREQPVDDANAADAEMGGPDQTAGVLRAHPRRRPRTARRAGRSVRLDASFQDGATRFFSVEGRQPLPGDQRDALFRIGTADYLQTLGVTLVEGACSTRAMARRSSRRRHQRNARPPIHAGTIGAWPANPIRPDGAVVHRRRRREERPRSWIRAGVEALCLRDGGTGAALLSDGESDRARRQRPARLCAGSPADHS